MKGILAMVRMVRRGDKAGEKREVILGTAGRNSRDDYFDGTPGQNMTRGGGLPDS